MSMVPNLLDFASNVFERTRYVLGHVRPRKLTDFQLRYFVLVYTKTRAKIIQYENDVIFNYDVKIQRQTVVIWRNSLISGF
jgi:hypothetical protein